MLLAPLIVVVAGIARVTSRIVRGWVRRNVRAIIGGAHPLEESAPIFAGASIHRLASKEELFGKSAHYGLENELRNGCGNARETVVL
jgi:nicotinate-nucleotide pyrophosphorylase